MLATDRLRSREPTSLGATQMNSLPELRTGMNSGQERIRGHGLL